MKYNVIFLDVDGVLNTELAEDFTFHELHMGEGKLNVKCILNLKKIIKQSNKNTRIVLSSSWRTDEWRINKLKYYLNLYGIDAYNIIIDTTPRIGNRTKDISTWLERNGEKVDKWVAIDDYSLDLDFAVRTDPKYGLTNENADFVLNIISDSIVT